MSEGIYYVAAEEEDDKILSHGNMKCRIELLDGSSELFILSKKSCGQCLLDIIFDSLNIAEKDFFGLQYQDSHSSTGYFNKWLNSVKSIRKQMSGCQPYRFQFKVRFYPNNASQMNEEYTRYLLFLQIKRDILEQKIFCDRGKLLLLAGYAIQSELGDYDPKRHHSGYVSKYKFVHHQDIQFENDVHNLHVKLRNLTQNEAEDEYVNLVTHLEFYGVETSKALNSEKDKLEIGPSSLGFNVFRENERIALYVWSAIFKISFKKKKISLQIKTRENLYDEPAKHIPQCHIFTLNSMPECKTLWQNCVDYHTFFRVKNPPTHSKSNNNKGRCNLFCGSVTPAFGGRRTMPLIEDLQKRSHTTDRSFMRTPIRVRKYSFSRNNSTRSQKPDIVSHSLIALSSIKSTDTSFHFINKNNILDSQISLDYTPKQATFDSDNSSMDDNDIRECDNIDRLPDSGSFLISSHSMREKRNLDRTTCSSSSSDVNPQRQSSLTNCHRCIRSSALSNRSKIMNKSIDESNETLDRPLLLNHSAESLTELRSASNNQSFSTLTSSAQYRLPDLSKFSNHISSPKVESNKRNGLTSLLPIKFDTNQRYNTLDKEHDSDLEIKLRCDRTKRFGFKIKSSVDRGSPMIIESIEKDMPADTCFPRLNEGDQLMSINGEDVNHLRQDEIISLIKRCSEVGPGEIILTVKPINYMTDHNNEILGRDLFQGDNLLLDQKIPLFSLSVKNGLKNDPLKESIRILEKNIDNDGVIRQFETTYRKKPGLTMIEAKKLENSAKNRYRDISPYDQTRVILNCDNYPSDYINASFINMRITDQLTNRYIATQGPLQNTSADFWLMCWQQKIHLVVMLTTLSEQGRPKCHKYWPPIYDTIEFGNFQISCLSEYHSEDGGFAIRDLIIYHTPSKKETKVQHMQYISWPDHGVPAVHYEFINFVDKVREFRSHHSEHIIVHCSAGIGRTGVLITMESAMCLIEAKQAIDPVSILRSMRDQRASMIQTAAQFKFVCEAIVKVHKDRSAPSL